MSGRSGDDAGGARRAGPRPVEATDGSAGPGPAAGRPGSGSGSRGSGSARARGRRGWPALRRRAVEAWRGLLETPWVWTLVLVLVGTWCLAPQGFLPDAGPAVGEIADRDWVAPRDLLVPDQDTTRDKQAQARDEVLPVWDFDPGVADDLDRRLAVLFQVGRQLLESGEATTGGRGAAPGMSDEEVRAALRSDLATASGLKLGQRSVDVLARQGFAGDLEDQVRLLARRAFREGVVEGKARLLEENRLRGIVLRDLESGDERVHLDLYAHLDHPADLRELIEAEVADWRELSATGRRGLVELLVDNMAPNLSPNRSETVERRQAAAEAVAPSFKQVREGQVIVRRGDEVSPAAARMIAEVTGGVGSGRLLMPLLGLATLLGLTALLLWLGLRPGRLESHSQARLFSEAVVLLVGALLATRLAVGVTGALAGTFEQTPWNLAGAWLHAVPFAALGLVAALLLGRSGAVLLAVVYGLLVGWLTAPEAGLSLALYAVIGGLTAVFAVEIHQVRNRLTMMKVGLLVGVANAVSVLVLGTLGAGAEATSPAALTFDVVMAVAGGLVVGAVATVAVPLLEVTLGITTDIKLVELSNTNLPLLRRLAFEAPGTFQHSLMVANLAKEGCEAIDADPILAYAGGLYHDIGKMFRPDFFIENQRPGHNPHDTLQPSMSALVLINHVKEGLELARQHHLPEPLREAIAQHHGTRLIGFFYNRAKERCEREEDRRALSEEKYRYPGPKPQSRVHGVLMLADGVEAASRTLTDPSPNKLRSLVRRIVDDCLDDDQLDESGLTLSDLRQVSEAFQRVLSTIFHQRIDYPGFDFNDPRPPVQPVAAEVALGAGVVPGPSSTDRRTEP